MKTTMSQGETVSHTPGPWIHTPLHLKYLSVHADSGNPHLTRGRICQIDGPARTRAEVEANARLIASAPDLLEACKVVVASIERNTPALPNLPGLRTMLDGLQRQCQRAIDKTKTVE